MKSLLKALLRPLWQLTAPIRRPFVRKFDAHVNDLVNRILQTELEETLAPALSTAIATTTRTVDRLDALIAQTERSSKDTDQALNTLLSETVRLREQVHALQRLIQPNGVPDGHDGELLDDLVGYEDRDEHVPTFPADPAEERARVG
jgi:hypothetical protein